MTDCPGAELAPPMGTARGSTLPSARQKNTSSSNAVASQPVETILWPGQAEQNVEAAARPPVSFWCTCICRRIVMTPKTAPRGAYARRPAPPTSGDPNGSFEERCAWMRARQAAKAFRAPKTKVAVKNRKAH